MAGTAAQGVLGRSPREQREYGIVFSVLQVSAASATSKNIAVAVNDLLLNEEVLMEMLGPTNMTAGTTVKPKDKASASVSGVVLSPHSVTE